MDLIDVKIKVEIVPCVYFDINVEMFNRVNKFMV